MKNFKSGIEYLQTYESVRFCYNSFFSDQKVLVHGQNSALALDILYTLSLELNIHKNASSQAFGINSLIFIELIPKINFSCRFEYKIGKLSLYPIARLKC